MEKKEDSHLEGLRGSRHFSDQAATAFRADCVRAVAAGTDEEDAQTARSSAKMEEEEPGGKEEGRSLIKMRKRTGPRTEPWGTPRRRWKERLSRF